MKSITWFSKNTFFRAFHDGEKWLWENRKIITIDEYCMENNILKENLRNRMNLPAKPTKG